jgi:DNA mismatch repair protein PMS2
VALTETFDSERSSFVLNATQLAIARKEENTAAGEDGVASSKELPLFIPDDEDQNGDDISARAQDTMTIGSVGEPMSIDDTSIIPLTKELAITSPSPADEPLARKRPRFPSHDPVSGEEENTSKKVARSPSQTPTRAFSASSQRLAGPGRTPARVEQILSENTSGSSGRAVQMVLDTAGASWNLKPGQEGPPRKRLHPAEVSGSSSGKSARVNMRARLAGFARDGARVAEDKEDEVDSDGPEDEGTGDGAERPDMDEEEEWPRARSSSSKKTDDADITEPEIGDDGQSSTDVVEETMAIDSSDSEDDESSKLPNDVSRSVAVATAASPSSAQAADDLTPSADLLQNSSSDGGVAVALSSPSKTSGVRTEVVRTIVGDAPPLAFDLERTNNAWRAYLERRAFSQSQPPQPAARSSDLESADLGADDEKATAALARVLSKADFDLMDVVGQFNRGFIVARLCKNGGEGGGGATDDLFIVDQHAADEKYNFETLQATTRLESQRLFT